MVRVCFIFAIFVFILTETKIAKNPLARASICVEERSSICVEVFSEIIRLCFISTINHQVTGSSATVEPHYHILRMESSHRKMTISSCMDHPNISQLSQFTATHNIFTTLMLRVVWMQEHIDARPHTPAKNAHILFVWSPPLLLRIPQQKPKSIQTIVLHQ